MAFRPDHGTYPGDNDVFTPFPSRRSVVHSTKGIVSSVSPLASQAGLEILREGGNAAVSSGFPHLYLFLLPSLYGN